MNEHASPWRPSETALQRRPRSGNTTQSQAVVIDWSYGFSHHQRRHSTIGMTSPINYDQAAAPNRDAD